MPQSLKRILLVEDDRSQRELTRDFLLYQGYDVLEARDAQEALALLDNTPPDLIITDISLPGLNGLHLTEKIRALPAYSQTPIIVLSAYTGSSHRRKAEEAGGTRFLTKPINIQTLLQTIIEFTE